MSQPALSIDDLTFRYREREQPSLWNISLQVDPGELLLMAGASKPNESVIAKK